MIMPVRSEIIGVKMRMAIPIAQLRGIPVQPFGP